MADSPSRTGVKWVWLVLMALLGAVLVMYVIVGFEDDNELADGATATGELSDVQEPSPDIVPLVESTEAADDAVPLQPE